MAGVHDAFLKDDDLLSACPKDLSYSSLATNQHYLKHDHLELVLRPDSPASVSLSASFIHL